MEKGFRFRRCLLSVIAGWIFILSILIFFSISTLYFPIPFNYFKYQISDLGYHKLNPDGAKLFNLGCIISGILLSLFFLGLYKLYEANHKIYNILLFIVQIGGIYTALSLMMIGVYSKDRALFHSFWMINFFGISLLLFLFLSIFLYTYRYTRTLSYIGFSLLSFNALLLFILGIVPILEWITIMLFFILLIITLNLLYFRIERFYFKLTQFKFF